MKYWLLKTEPSCYSIDDLERETIGTWDGVRNFQARNFLRDDFQTGDLCLVYHSSISPPGVAGICQVICGGIPDNTAFDPHAEHFDPQSHPDHPTWYMVKVRFQKKFPSLLSLPLLKTNPILLNMRLFQRGNRLSVFPVTHEEFLEIERMGSAIQS